MSKRKAPRDDVREKVARRLLELEVFGVFYGHKNTTAIVMKDALFVADAILALVLGENVVVERLRESIETILTTDTECDSFTLSAYDRAVLTEAIAKATPEREDDADRGSHYAFCEPTP